MKGGIFNSLKLNGLENKKTVGRLLASPGINLNPKNHFFVVEQEEQSPEQDEAAGDAFREVSFLADSL